MLEEYEKKNLFYKSDFLKFNIMVEENINYYINEITEYYYEIFGGKENEKKVWFHTV